MIRATGSVLGLLLVLSTSAAQAQTSQPPAAADNRLVIFVLEGQRAVHNVPAGLVTPPVVEVRDSNGRPIEGAEVTFELPSSGPGGFFPGKQLTLTVTTDYQGQAAARGFEPNDQVGRFLIRVIAMHANLVQVADIVQTNSREEYVPRPMRRSWIRRWWKPLVIAGSAGAATAIVLSRRGSSPQDVIISAGPIIIGGPR